uniref:Uncharacterized protein n=1 Tax=Tetranychus urticae TaxID=32264 RepID=T1K0Y4_TETUR
MMPSLWSVLWFLALLLFGYPCGFFFALFYVLFQPFAVCCSSMARPKKYIKINQNKKEQKKVVYLRRGKKFHLVGGKKD